MAEVLEAEIALQTHEAFANLQSFLQQLERAQQTLAQASSGVNLLDVALSRNASSYRVAGEAARDEGQFVERTTQSYKMAGDAAHDSGNKRKTAAQQAAEALRDEMLAAKNAGDAVSQTNSLGSLATNIVGGWTTAVGGLITSYLGLNSVIDVINRTNQAQKDLIQTQNSLVESRLSFNKQLRDFSFNVNLPQTAAGQESARALLSRFMERAPAADIPTIQEVAGQAAAFGFDVQAAGPGQEIATDVMRMAARLGLEPGTAGDVMRVLNAMNVRDPAGARTVMSQLEAAARTSPIASPARFMSAGLRATLPMISQGVSLGQAFGVFAAAAGPETSPERAATQAEQFQRLFRGGPEDKPLANLFERAVATGLLDRRQFGQMEMQVVGAVAPEFQSRYSSLQRTLTNAQADLGTDQGKFDRDIQDIMRRRDAAQNRGADITGFAKQITDRQESFERQRRDTLQKITSAEERVGDVQREMATKIGPRFGAAAWRSLPLAQRLQLFNTMAGQAKTPQELESFLLSAGASAEEARAGINIMAGGGPRAAAETAEEIAAARPEDFQRRNAESETLDIAREQQARNRELMTRSGGVGEPETMLGQLRSGAAARGQVIENIAGGRPFNVGAEFFRQVVFRDEVMNQIQAFYSTTTDEERQAFPEIDQLANEAADLLRDWGSTLGEDRLEGMVNRLFMRLVRLARQVQEWRRTNPNVRRTTVRPRRTIYDPARDRWRDLYERVPFQRPLFGDQQPAPAAASNRQVSMMGAGGPMFGSEVASAGDINYNVSIGTLVSGGADVLDTVGRLDASERA